MFFPPTVPPACAYFRKFTSGTWNYDTHEGHLFGIYLENYCDRGPTMSGSI